MSVENGKSGEVFREQVRLDALLTTALIQMARHADADWEMTGVQSFLIERRGFRVKESSFAREKCGWRR